LPEAHAAEPVVDETYTETALPLERAVEPLVQEATAAGTFPGATARLPAVPELMRVLAAPFTWFVVEVWFVVVTVTTDARTKPPVIPRIATTVAA